MNLVVEHIVTKRVCCRLTGVKKVTSKKRQKLVVQVGYLPRLPRSPITTKIGVDCPLADIISHAKFKLDRFRGFRAPDGRKSLSPIDLRVATLPLQQYTH